MSAAPKAESSAQVDPRVAAAVAAAITQSIAAVIALEAQVKRALAAIDPLLSGPVAGEYTPDAVNCYGKSILSKFPPGGTGAPHLQERWSGRGIVYFMGASPKMSHPRH